MASRSLLPIFMEKTQDPEEPVLLIALKIMGLTLCLWSMKYTKGHLSTLVTFHGGISEMYARITATGFLRGQYIQMFGNQ